MKKSTRNIIIAVVILVILLLAWWWYKKDDVKIMITSVVPSSMAGASRTTLTLGGTTSSKSNPAKWVGRTIHIYTASMGTVTSTVSYAAVTNGAVEVTTDTINFASAFTYAHSASDHARIYLKVF